MKTHFEIQINYHNKAVNVIVQCISNQLPNITYIIWPKDEELKKHFENVKQFYFHINSKLNKTENILEITNYVIYDYKTESNKFKDCDFEFGVWNSLLKYDS